MRRPAKPATIIRHLQAVVKRAGDTTQSEDKAILAAIEIVKRSIALEALRSTTANLVADGECTVCMEDGFDENPECPGNSDGHAGRHHPYDMPCEDAIDSLHSLIRIAREIGVPQ